MRHSKRKKLSTEDVERALKWYDAPPSLGHQHNESDPSYVQVPDVGRLRDGEAIFAPEEQVIGNAGYFYIEKWTVKAMCEVYYRAKRDKKEAT